MAALSPYLRSAEDNGLHFWCPGCQRVHQVKVGEGAGPRWSYNNNPDKPSFIPSVLLKSGHYAEAGHPGNCWCDFKERAGQDAPFSCMVCHSYITEGKIQFLSDCTHALAGQTVDLPVFPGYRVE